jgi:alpha/beta superfamily hydrolase
MDRHRPAEQGAGTLRTGDGTALASEWSVTDGAVAAAVLTHPHPLMGGDMRAPVPDALFRALPGEGIAVLRFDFRGGGRSSGTHDGGGAEADDVRAAVERLGELAPGVPLWVVGYSFGADVALQVVDQAIAGWVLVAPPLRSVPVERMAAATDPRPKLVLVPAHDQFCDPSAAQEATEGWAATTIEVVPGADHFLAGRMSVVAGLVVAALRPGGP